MAINKKIQHLSKVLNSHSAVKFSDSDFKVKPGNRDWRTYVPDEIKHVWKQLTGEAKHVAFIFAESQARIEAIREPKPMNKQNIVTQEQKNKIGLLRLRKSQKE